MSDMTFGQIELAFKQDWALFEQRQIRTNQSPDAPRINVGGDTLFASTAAAYDALSEAMKKMIEPLWAVHDYMQGVSMKRRDPAIVAELGTNNPPVAQPIVRVHEETGRKTLYVGDQLTRRIVGMTERESAPLLKFLAEHMVDPLFTYRQKLQKNDIIMWDNRSTMHLALADFPPGSHRYCVRTTILGSPSGHFYQGYAPTGRPASARPVSDPSGTRTR